MESSVDYSKLFWAKNAINESDLTPLDNFLWGYVKYFVYKDKPALIAALAINIERVSVEIKTEMCEKEAQNLTFQME